MKIGKEIKTNNFKNYKSVFGSVNNKDPKSVYINISSWAEPSDDDVNENRNKIIRILNKRIKQNLFNNFEKKYHNFFNSNNIIVILDIKESGVKFGKRSFMSCEINLFSKLELPVNSDIMKEILADISKELIEEVFEKFEYFKFHKKKR